MYSYLIYGIIIKSEVKLYNIPETEGLADVHVRLGEVDYYKNETAKEFYFSEKLICLRTNDAAFSIEGGSLITVQLYTDIDENVIASTIIGWGLAFLFYQRGFSALHCTALEINDKGVLISGVSGAGKSSTAYSLISRGYRYLADDIAMLKPLESMDIVPAFPIQKICGNMINNIAPQELLYINEERDKYSYCNIESFCDAPKTLECIFLLYVDDISEVKVEEITGLNKYLKVLECLFLSEIYLFNGTPEADKLRCLKLAEKIRLFVITRPKEGDSLEKVTDEIEKIMLR